jgi:hypothetical protein
LAWRQVRGQPTEEGHDAVDDPVEAQRPEQVERVLRPGQAEVDDGRGRGAARLLDEVVGVAHVDLVVVVAVGDQERPHS